MRSRKMKFWLAACAVALCCSAATAASLGTIKGRVSDSEGAAIKGAHVLFHPDPSGQGRWMSRPDVTRETDAVGRFDIQLEPGFYDICVMATAFTPECKKILVTNGSTLQHDIQLKADPLVVQHLGDRF
jgi:Carboxypeptidase regulatory-like domain